MVVLPIYTLLLGPWLDVDLGNGGERIETIPNMFMLRLAGSRSGRLLRHLASLYREQRDMPDPQGGVSRFVLCFLVRLKRSPLWNTPLWKHFYQTFTPTCTLCEDGVSKSEKSCDRIIPELSVS